MKASFFFGDLLKYRSGSIKTLYNGRTKKSLVQNMVVVSVDNTTSAGGLEKSILKGTGKDQPIGMFKDLDEAVTQGVHSDKTKVKLNTLEPVEYCGVIAPLAEKPKGAGL